MVWYLKGLLPLWVSVIHRRMGSRDCAWCAERQTPSNPRKKTVVVGILRALSVLAKSAKSGQRSSKRDKFFPSFSERGQVSNFFFCKTYVDLQLPSVTLLLTSVPLQPLLNTLQPPLVALQVPSYCVPKY